MSFLRRLFKRMGSGEDDREFYTIHLNDKAANAAHAFPSNYIRTHKYTILSFLPVNLFEQFRRVANFYFLLSVIISLIPGVTPFLPITTILPLVFVLAVSAIKEALEDWKRYKADRQQNLQPFTVLRDGKYHEVASQELAAGDIVYMQRGETFPADLVVLSSALEEGVAYVETSNLDGETNLKMKQALAATCERVTPGDVSDLRGRVECELPNIRMHHFEGRVHLDGEVHPLTEKQLVLRGASLRNTAWMYGVVVYAGVDTKMFLNLAGSVLKFSRLERLLNMQVVGILCFELLCIVIAAGSSATIKDGLGDDSWYLGDQPESGGEYGGLNMLTYFVLLNTMIPISLYVTIEVVRFIQAQFMEWDVQMRTDPNDATTGMKARTSNLNEELGQIEYVFSDKTGTLTENIMEFAKCAVGGAVYDEMTEHGTGTILAAIQSDEAHNREHLIDMLIALTTCHTVVPEGEGDAVVYQAESPDEAALVEAAARNGVILQSRSSKGLRLDILGNDVTYEVLAVLPFTPERKRMSVLVRSPDKQITLYAKGADAVMLELLRADHPPIDHTIDVLHEYAEEGLRTLVVGRRDVSNAEYEEWLPSFQQAQYALDDRASRIADACAELELGMDVVGCTAVEDKLQDGVPETIRYLLEAGVHVWMLTGDKQETAINIGHSTNLIRHSGKLILLNANNADEAGAIIHHELEQVRSDMEGGWDLALIADGRSLGFALDHHKEDLLELTDKCYSVVCCRVTPLQKARVVEMVKLGKQKHCLSIGDGANDVSMILAADVGVGIYGREGTQAARASDYAIGRFRHLKRLLCVHGRYSYMRMADLIQYSFYKNISFTTPQFWFSVFNMFTGQTLWDQWIVAGFNTFFTSLPPLFYALFEKDIIESVIYEYPQAYRRLHDDVLFNWRTFTRWISEALFNSVIIFFMLYALFGNDILLPNGHTMDIWAMGSIGSTIAITVVNLRMALLVKYWTWLNHFAVWGSILFYFIVCSIYTTMDSIPTFFFGVFFVVIKSASFWFLFFVVPVMCLTPVVCGLYIQRQYFPLDWQILQEQQVVEARERASYASGGMPQTMPLTRTKSKRRSVQMRKL